MEKINFNINDIRSFAEDNKTYNRGIEYYNKNYVGHIDYKREYDLNFNEYLDIYSAKIKGNYYSSYDTSVKVDGDGSIIDFDCNCPAFAGKMGSCKHITALMLKIYYRYNKIFKQNITFDIFKKQTIKQQHSYHLENLINVYENNIIDMVKIKNKVGDVNLKPILFVYEKDSIGLEFTIGNKRNYVVKDAYALANYIKNSTLINYGKNLEFNHEISGFEKSSQPLAKFLKDETDVYRQVIAKTQNVYNSNNINGRLFKIFSFSLDSFFNLFKNQTIECHGYNYKYTHLTFTENDPLIEFSISKKDDNYYFSTDFFITYNSSSKDYTYIIADNTFYKCSKHFANTIIPAVNKIMMQPSKSILIPDNYFGKFFSVVLLQISKYATVNYHTDISDKIKIETFSPSIYFDANNLGTIYAEIIYNYGDIEINPLRKFSTDNTIARNLLEEAKIITAVENAGFIQSSVKYSMEDENSIYEFLTEGITSLTTLCEVNLSDDFKKINIRYPKSISMGVRLKSDLIHIDIDKLEFDADELHDILDMYKRRKKYFRLKDGSFLNLNNNYFNTIEKLVDDLDISNKELESLHFSIPKYRSLYLDSIIKSNEWINALKEQNFKEMILNINKSNETDFELPDELKPIMRNYQKTGYKWLKTLSSYFLGGILADDMGLGKTIQIISLILSEKNIRTKPSIVISPTSLVYNWKSEIEKFAPNITTSIISGSALQRVEAIKDINNYDLIFTSYDLIKRDIELYENIDFRYCILDEAQYIKNATTQNAKAVKLIKSEVRFALTGTPIENSLADLWSIFDFIMPKFLLSYKKFKNKYELPIIKYQNEEILSRLHKQIQPFILRRLKKDVLKELPDKIETISYAQMETIQSKLYAAELMKFNKEFKEEISQNGYDKSQIKILAMLTKLRQICCHPSLYFDNYKGSSAKLELCMEIVLNSIETGHKILIFSQFTTMLKIIEEQLNNLSINYYKLTGATKSKDRLELANKFNKDSTPIFLISLKAGGTGLNLTGADVVIHFDPWWNISAQNQATDRTHRIGQENKVQVFKLIVKDTIEEKIEKLQQSKKDLADSVIKKGEVVINTLSKDEMKSLFQL